MEEFPGEEDHVWEPTPERAGGLIRLGDAAASEPLGREAVSLRRAVRRSKSDPRETRPDSEVLGDQVRGSILGLSAGDLGPAVRSAPIRLPILDRGTSDDCVKLLLEKKLDRSEPILDPKLGVLGRLGVTLGDGARLVDGLKEDRRPGEEGRETDGGVILEKDGRLGWLELMDGLDQLEPVDEFDRPALIDGPELLADDCIRDKRSAIKPRPKLCREMDEDAPARLSPSDLSRPSA